MPCCRDPGVTPAAPGRRRWWWLSARHIGCRAVLRRLRLAGEAPPPRRRRLPGGGGHGRPRPAPPRAPPRRHETTRKNFPGGPTAFLRTDGPWVLDPGFCARLPSAGAGGRELTAPRRNSFKEIGLADYKGKWLVLYFYPLDFTFVCPTEICAFSDRVGEFHKLGAEVVGVSVDSKYAHLAFSQLERKKVRPPRPPARPPRRPRRRPFGIPKAKAELTRRGGGGTTAGAHCRAGWAGASTRCWRTSPRRCRRTTAC